MRGGQAAGVSGEGAFPSDAGWGTNHAPFSVHDAGWTEKVSVGYGVCWPMRPVLPLLASPVAIPLACLPAGLPPRLPPRPSRRPDRTYRVMPVPQCCADLHACHPCLPQRTALDCRPYRPTRCRLSAPALPSPCLRLSERCLLRAPDRLRTYRPHRLRRCRRLLVVRVVALPARRIATMAPPIAVALPCVPSSRRGRAWWADGEGGAETRVGRGAYGEGGRGRSRPRPSCQVLPRFLLWLSPHGVRVLSLPCGWERIVVRCGLGFAQDLRRSSSSRSRGWPTVRAL